MDPSSEARRKERGRAGEDQALAYLRQAGYQIAARNYRCREGEVDLVAEQGDLLAFVEVRSRASATFEGPEATVGRGKQRKVARAALHYTWSHGICNRPIRFDVIAITGRQVQHFQNAFDATM